jgi:hypothetical protein
MGRGPCWFPLRFQAGKRVWFRSGQKNGVTTNFDGRPCDDSSRPALDGSPSL